MYPGWTLMWFEAISWIRINLIKSEIIHVGRVDNVELLLLSLAMVLAPSPLLIWVIPLGAPHKSVGVWDFIEDRFRKRLASWKRQYISKGGRLTLIRSTLSISYLFFRCQRWCALDWRRFRETFFGVAAT